MTTKATQVVRKAATWGIPPLLIIGLVITFLGKQILAWPANTTASISENRARIGTVEKEVIHQKEIVTLTEDQTKKDIKEAKTERKEIRTEQKALRDDMNDGFKEIMTELRNGR